MKQTLLAALTAALVLVSARADDKPAEKKDRETQFKDLQGEFRKMMPDVVKEWRSAGTVEEKNKALAKLDPIIDRGFKLIAENPKDDVSFDTLMFLMGSKPEAPPKVLDLLTEHHLNNKKLAAAVPGLSGNSTPGVKKLLRAAMEQSTSKEVKGAATYAYAQSLNAEVEGTRDEKKAAALSKEVETLLDKVVREFGDVGRLKKDAEKTLFEIRNLSIGKSAPEVVSKDLDDKEAKLSALKGKVVVLDIWATWCGPCRAMIPHEREMVEKLKDKPFQLISVSADDKLETLKEFLEKEKMPWTHWWEGRRDGGIINDWNVRFFPTIYVIDAKGVIRFKNVRGKQLEEAVEKLIEETAKK